jgi:hypothetical protein
LPSQPTVYQCLLISPSDVQEERDAVSSTVDRWNGSVGVALGTRIQVSRWEQHAIPTLSLPAQEAIDSQLTDLCDFGIAIFWSRLGTPTGEHDSGSLAEIDRLLQACRPVLVYFCQRPVPQAALRDDQYRRLQEAKAALQGRGLTAEYSSVESLCTALTLHLTRVVADLESRHKIQLGSSVASSPGPAFDLRVTVRPSVAVAPDRSYRRSLDVKIANYSPVLKAFIRQVTFRLADGRQLFVKQDSLTGEYQRRRILEPGESFDFHVAAETLTEQGLDNILYAGAIDDLGRVYESDATEFRNALNSFLT